MPIDAHRWLGPALLGAILALSPTLVVQAQDAAPMGKADRTWTDPPVRGSAATATQEAPKAIAPGPSVAQAPDAAPKPVQAAAARPVRHAVALPAKAKHRAVAVHTLARKNLRIAAHSGGREHDRSRGIAVVRPSVLIRGADVRMVARQPVPSEDDPAFPIASPRVRYGYTNGLMPAGGFGDLFEDDRARRIRQAREAGYLVVRSRTIVLPDGRRLQSYRPYQSDDSDD
ncbi:hypothetical protein G3T14_03625 [Methylobacterium sp. BTF04]|uniref:hypothetical protein n=1 Tax=Methylobacterium sp. BTF04 TaxID=2708300 RepID=UPI0013D4F549|nr:hypothetical protein [Methylobacterium sp. BTF04]NEU11216.1 hypothetical protein [Methylobacterium sp. BTF04]